METGGFLIGLVFPFFILFLKPWDSGIALPRWEMQHRVQKEWGSRGDLCVSFPISC